MAPTQDRPENATINKSICRYLSSPAPHEYSSPGLGQADTHPVDGVIPLPRFQEIASARQPEAAVPSDLSQPHDVLYGLQLAGPPGAVNGSRVYIRAGDPRTGRQRREVRPRARLHKSEPPRSLQPHHSCVRRGSRPASRRLVFGGRGRQGRAEQDRRAHLSCSTHSFIASEARPGRASSPRGAPSPQTSRCEFNFPSVIQAKTANFAESHR